MIQLGALLVAGPLLVSAGPAPAVVKEMTPDLIRAAIAAQKADDCYDLKVPDTTAFMKMTAGCFTTPWSRVVQAAKAARAKYKPFTEADVTPEMIAPEIRVFAYPIQGLRGASSIDVDAIVVMPRKSKERSEAVHPTTSEEINTEYKNLLGATWEGRGMMAVFPLELVSADNEVRIVYESNVCKLGGFGKPSADCPAKFDLSKVK